MITTKPAFVILFETTVIIGLILDVKIIYNKIDIKPVNINNPINVPAIIGIIFI